MRRDSPDGLGASPPRSPASSASTFPDTAMWLRDTQPSPLRNVAMQFQGLGTLWHYYHLIGSNLEMYQAGSAKRGSDGNVCRVAPCRHQHASDPRHVVSRIESPPAIFEIHFEPCAEVHGSVHQRN